MELKQRPYFLVYLMCIFMSLFGLVFFIIGGLFFIIRFSLLNAIPVIIGLAFILIPIFIILLSRRELTIKGNDLYLKVSFWSRSYPIREIEEIQKIYWFGFGEIQDKENKTPKWISLRVVVKGKKSNLLALSMDKSNKSIRKELDNFLARLKSVNGDMKITEHSKTQDLIDYNREFYIKGEFD